MYKKNPFFKNNTLRSDRLLKVSIFGIHFIVLCLHLYFSQAYAAQVLPSKNLDRRPLHSVNPETRMKRQESVPGSLLLPPYLVYCDRGNKIVIKQDDPENEISMININGVDYPVDALPNNISYRNLTLKEAGEEGAKGFVVLPTEEFTTPMNISLYADTDASGSGMAPMKTVQFLDVDHINDPNYYFYCGDPTKIKAHTPRLCGKKFTNIYHNEYQAHAERFQSEKQNLRTTSGNLTLLDDSFGGQKLWGLHLDRTTGFDLSSLNSTRLSDHEKIIVFLDRYDGEIELPSTAIVPELPFDSRVYFIGVDSSSPNNPGDIPPRVMDAPTAIAYNGTESSPVLDCKNAVSCAIMNVNLKVIDSNLYDRELITGPKNSAFALSVTYYNETGAPQTYFFEHDYYSPDIDECSLGNRGITVYSDQNIENINDLACSMCTNENGICSIGDFCTGPNRYCPNQVTFDRRLIDCNVYPTTATSPTATTSTAATAAATLGGSTILKFTGAFSATGFLAAAGLTATVVTVAGGIYYCYHYGKCCFSKRKKACYTSSAIEHQASNYESSADLQKSDHEASVNPQDLVPPSFIEHQASDNEVSIDPQEQKDEPPLSSGHQESDDLSSIEVQKYDDYTVHDQSSDSQGVFTSIYNYIWPVDNYIWPVDSKKE